MPKPLKIWFSFLLILGIIPITVSFFVPLEEAAKKDVIQTPLTPNVSEPTETTVASIEENWTNHEEEYEEELTQAYRKSEPQPWTYNDWLKIIGFINGLMVTWVGLWLKYKEVFKSRRKQKEECAID